MVWGTGPAGLRIVLQRAARRRQPVVLPRILRNFPGAGGSRLFAAAAHWRPRRRPGRRLKPPNGGHRVRNRGSQTASKPRAVPCPGEGRYEWKQPASPGPPQPDDDETTLAQLGYKQTLQRGWSSFSNFAISFTIISVFAGCFTTYGQRLEQRWADRDLLGLADHLRPRPVRRLLDVGAGVQAPVRRRHLLLGVGPRWQDLGLVHGPVDLIGLVGVVASVIYASATLPRRPARACMASTLRHGSLRGNAHVLSETFVLFVVILAPARGDQHLLLAAGRPLQQRLGLLACARRRSRDRDPDYRPRPSTRAPTSSSPRRSTTPASPTAPGAAASSSGSTCCRSASF